MPLVPTELDKATTGKLPANVLIATPAQIRPDRIRIENMGETIQTVNSQVANV